MSIGNEYDSYYEDKYYDDYYYEDQLWNEAYRINNYHSNIIKINVPVQKTNCEICMRLGISITLSDDIQDCVDCLTGNINFEKEI